MSFLGEIEAAVGRSDWRKAKQLADVKIARHPNQSRLHFYSGLSSLKMGHLEAAVEELRCAVALNEQDWEAGTALAQALDRLLRFEEALEVTEQFLRVRPSDPTLNHLRRGLKRQVPDKITDAWEKSVQLDHYEVELTTRDEQ
jgi:uncharacterized protein HemY